MFKIRGTAHCTGLFIVHNNQRGLVNDVVFFCKLLGGEVLFRWKFPIVL